MVSDRQRQRFYPSVAWLTQKECATTTKIRPIEILVQFHIYSRRVTTDKKFVGYQNWPVRSISCISCSVLWTWLFRKCSRDVSCCSRLDSVFAAYPIVATASESVPVRCTRINHLHRFYFTSKKYYGQHAASKLKSCLKAWSTTNQVLIRGSEVGPEVWLCHSVFVSNPLSCLPDVPLALLWITELVSLFQESSDLSIIY